MATCGSPFRDGDVNQKRDFTLEFLSIFQNMLLVSCHAPHIQSSCSADNSHVEADWDLGPLATVQHYLPLDKHLLELQITNKLYGAKSNMHSWGKLWTKDNNQKKQIATSEELRTKTKTGCQEQKQVTMHSPCTQHNLTSGQNS